jgi:hypothetical protein
MGFFIQNLKTIIKSIGGDITDGLIAWYKLNGDANDSSSKGNNGTLINSPSYTTGQDGVASHALYLNGTTPSAGVYMDVGNSNNFDFYGKDVSFSLWINPTVNNLSSYYTALIVKRPLTSSLPSYEIYLASGSGNIGFWNGSLFTSTVSPTTGVWNYITVTLTSGGSIIIYLNGTSVYSNTGAGITADVSSNLIFGYISNGSSDQQQYYGKMDDVRIYNRALDASEVTTLYNNGAR